MKKSTIINLKYLFLILGILFLQACQHSTEAPPFPSLKSEFAQPITKSFEFSKTDTIKWTTVDKSKIKPLPTKSFSWDKLPSKPFDIDIPYALTEPLPQKKLDWNSLPETNFDFNKLPKAKISIKTTFLGKPKIVKAGNPINMPNASRGITQMDANFGLPGAPYCIITDSYGMLWIGTEAGIAKYDSENLEIYGADQGLNSKRTFAMLMDSKGRLWLGNSINTITVIDFKAQLIHELSSPFDQRNEYDMIETKDGKIWMSNNPNGYSIVDLESRTIRKLDAEHGLLGNFSITPFQDKEGLIWLTTDKGVTIIDLKNKKNKTLTIENKLQKPSFIFTVSQDREDKIWIGNGEGAQIINAAKTTISQLSQEQGLKESGGVANVYQDKVGKIWLGTTNGLLFSYDESKKELEKIDINKGRQILFNILQDKQRQIWTAIVEGGLYKLDPKNGRPGNYSITDGLTNNEVWSTLETKDGKIWIGTYNGIDVYDPKTQTLKHLGIEQGLVNVRNTRLIEDSKGKVWSCGSASGISIIDPKKGAIQQLTTKQGLKTDRIKAVLEDENGLFWIGGELGVIQTVDLENSIFKYYEATTEETKVANNIFVQDATNHIWIATLGTGIHIIDPKNNKRSQITLAEGLIGNQVYSLTLDEHQNIWAATEKGVVLIDAQKKELTTFTTDEGLAANDVYALIAHKGEIFNGTSKGLTILQPIEQKNNAHPFWKVKTLGKKQGLDQVDFSENSFTFDQKGRLWAGVNGIMLTVIDPIQKDNFDNTTFITGLNILDKKQVFIDKISIQKNRKALGKAWLSSKDTLLSEKNEIENSENKMHWNAVKGPYNLPEDLTLPANQNYLSFTYNGFQLNYPDKLVYSYFLEGIDKNWSPVSEKNTSENYRDLPSGDYIFKVVSKGLDGNWSKPAEFKFTILPPWWKTWWAYLAYFIILSFIGFMIHRFQKERTIRKERERAQQKELAQAKEIEKAYLDLKTTQSQLIQSEKMASLGELTAGIAHEIQNPLNFVNNFSEVSMELIDEMEAEIRKGDLEEAKTIAIDIKQNLEKINYHGKRADGIVKGMLQHSRAGNNVKEPTDINVLADEYLRLAYHGLRAKDKSFNAELETNFDANLPKINVIPQDVGRVLLNLFTNAFYATHQKQKTAKDDYKPLVAVTTTLKDEVVKITVKDNGMGIPEAIKDKIMQPFFTTKPAGEGTGLGLSLSYDIVVLSHGGSINIESKEGKGSVFIISLPFKN
jgi:signal transduction histidine kinase/ligand-binding sensor domain-containing protein